MSNVSYKKKYDPILLKEGLLIIANYNQEVEIVDYLDRAQRYFPISQSIVIDDGSMDRSPEIAKEIGYQVLRHNKNMGIGAAIRNGINHARKSGYNWVLISSSNGKIRPEDFESVYSPVARGDADYTTGTRFKEGGQSPNLTLFRRISIPIFSFVTSFLLGRRFSDITCGFRAYTLEIIDQSGGDLEQEWINRYELEYYLHYYVSRNKKARMKEVPVTIEYSHLTLGRTSKIKPVIGWWSMIRPYVFLFFRIKK